MLCGAQVSVTKCAPCCICISITSLHHTSETVYLCVTRVRASRRIVQFWCPCALVMQERRPYKTSYRPFHPTHVDCSYSMPEIWVCIIFNNLPFFNGPTCYVRFSCCISSQRCEGFRNQEAGQDVQTRTTSQWTVEDMDHALNEIFYFPA